LKERLRVEEEAHGAPLVQLVVKVLQETQGKKNGLLDLYVPPALLYVIVLIELYLSACICCSYKDILQVPEQNSKCLVVLEMFTL